MDLRLAEPRYAAAHAVAPILEEHFARHTALDVNGAALAPLPSAATIEAVIDAAFWASLRREEHYATKISIALLRPDDAERPLRFERPLGFTPNTLVRIAPAVERPGIHLGVWSDGGELKVWGTTRTVPMFTFVLEVAAPGLLVVKHHRGTIGKFVNVAVLEGEQAKLIDENVSRLPDCPSLLTSLLGFEVPTTWSGSVNVLVQVAASIRAHGRGGALLVVPADSDTWQESIVRPVAYAVAPPFSELADLMRQSPEQERDRGWEDAVEDAVEALAGLTAVDGATIITDRYEQRAFGAKIVQRTGWPLVESVVVTEPIRGAERAIVHPTQLGGTRHLSAAQFVHDQRDAVALVASQDGRFTVFAWSSCETMVHAHRVEALLL